MPRDDFNKLFWGFLFIMMSFRIQGVDILPDIVGYILFAIGFNSLSSESIHFIKARNFNIPMIIVSAFSIYQAPAQGGGVQFGPLGFLGILIAVASIILNLLVIYNLFMGIKDMSNERALAALYSEADRRWNQYLIFQIAAVCAFFFFLIPPIALVFMLGLFAASIVLTIVIMGFIKRCSISL